MMMTRKPKDHSSHQCCCTFPRLQFIYVQDHQTTRASYLKNYHKQLSTERMVHISLLMLWLPVRVKARQSSSKFKSQLINIKRCWLGRPSEGKAIINHWQEISLWFSTKFVLQLVMRSLLNIISDALSRYCLTAANLMFSTVLYLRVK